MAGAPTAAFVDEEITIGSRPVDLRGRLTVPERARGLVVFAHDAGLDARNRADLRAAGCLRGLGFGTLLFDLVALGETRPPAPEVDVDVDVLAVRLLAATRWLRTHPLRAELPIAYLGVRSGAAVALLAALDDPDVVAVATRGGRPDLLGSDLATVRTPTLFVVGGADDVSRVANETAASRMTCAHELAIVPGASDRFVEPGAVRTSSRLASAWFARHLTRPANRVGHGR